MRKLVWFTIGFSLAIGFGAYLLSPDYYLLVSGVCTLMLAACLALMLRFPKARIAAMVAFGLVAGFVWQSIFDANYLSVARSYNGQTVQLTLTATDRSELTNYGAATECRAELNGKSYKLIAYHEAQTLFSPGDTLTGQFLLRCTLPGCDSDSDYSRARGVFLTAKGIGELSAGTSEKMPWYTYPALWRIWLTDRIEDVFPDDTAGFAKALLLGDTSGIDYSTDTNLKLSGIRHVIAVSGLHVSILFSMVYFFFGRRRWLTALVGLPALALFAAVAGFSPSITRACIMHGLTVVALLLDKEYDSYSALSFAVIVMLLVNPWSVTNVGFQLSAGCLVGIFLFAEPIEQWLLDRKRLGKFRGWSGRIGKWVAVSVSVSLSANVFTAALSGLYFGTMSLVGVLTNLLTLWIVTFLFCGILLCLAVSVLFYPMAIVISSVISWGIRYVLWIANALAEFPLSAVYTGSIYIVIWVVFCYLLLAVFLLSQRKHPFVLSCCAVLGLCVVLIASWLEPLSDDCRMTVLDVGQGQCILLQSEGKNYLIDCGGDSDTAAADKAAALLFSQGIRKLDGLILTHYDSDHAGGAVLLMQRIDAQVLFLPNSEDIDGRAKMLTDLAKGEVVFVNQEVSITFGEAKITLLPSQNAETDNESGLCVLFHRENCDILITGDRSASGERELIEQISLPQLDVLIVGHHGSKYSTCRELLITTQPEIAIISVGADNFYGHPTQEVLDRLLHYGCLVLRTDLHGNIVYRG